MLHKTHFYNHGLYKAHSRRIDVALIVASKQFLFNKSFVFSRKSPKTTKTKELCNYIKKSIYYTNSKCSFRLKIKLYFSC